MARDSHDFMSFFFEKIKALVKFLLENLNFSPYYEFSIYTTGHHAVYKTLCSDNVGN